MRSKKFIISFLKIITIAYAVLILILVTAEDYIFHPGYFMNKNACILKAEPWKQYSTFMTTTWGDKIQTWYIPKDNAPPLVYFGGNGMDNASILPWLNARKNLSVATMNYRGFGQSQGHPSEINNVVDSIQFLDHISKISGYPTHEIILVGESIGSGVASQVAAQRPVKQLILLVPFESLSSIAQEKCPIIPMDWVLRNTYRSQQAAKNIHCPVTIIAAENDKLIPVKHAQKLATAYKTPATYHEIKEANHKNLRLYDEFHNIFDATCFSSKKEK